MSRPPTLSDDEILRRAGAVFVEHGYAARTKEISAAVGLTWGALAFRFGEKRELFRRAMLDPVQRSCAAQGPNVVADLRVLLEQVRAEVWEQWPRRLQYRLAAQGAVSDEGWLRLADWLGVALQQHAERGFVRRDIPWHALALLVFDLLLGDVARRFMLREPESDPRLIERVLRLVEVRTTAGTP